MPVTDLQRKIFQIKSELDFSALALEVFRFQARENSVYKSFLKETGKNAEGVATIHEIPFLPVEFFRQLDVIADSAFPELIFTSSGTTGMSTGRHLVADKSVYEESFVRCFKLFYGDPKEYCILALLPSYLERSGSSLVYMMDALIKMSGHPSGGFYLDEQEQLAENLGMLKSSGQKTILLGVTFALLDFAEKYPVRFPELILMETGGMKGRKKELVRQEVHEVLCKGFGVNHIHSEYGMTEMLSQAYSASGGIFQTPPWMKVLMRDPNDPFSFIPTGSTGGINVIDLANLFSCSFLATQDLGRYVDATSFEVLGRFDNSDIRGCNLMIV